MTNGVIPRTPSAEDISLTWHALSANEVLQKLDTPESEGLSLEEVEKRQEKFGLNQLTEKPKATFLQMVFSQLKSFVILLLIVASIISAVLGEYVDAAAIIAIVVLNAVLGVVQESRAEQALAAGFEFPFN